MLKIMCFSILVLSRMALAAALPISGGAGWRQAWQEQILRAQDPRQLQVLIEKKHRAEVFFAACELQLGRRQIPMACYELKIFMPELQHNFSDEYLEHACMQAADNFQDVQLDSQQITSAKCRNKLTQKILLNRYKNGR